MTCLAELFSASVQNPVPQGMKPSIEVLLNHDFYPGLDIYTKGMQAVAQGERYPETPSAAAKTLGQGFEVFGKKIGLSPVQIEHLVGGYGSGFATALLRMTDILLPTAGPEKAEARGTEAPIIGSLFQQKDAIGVVQRLYDDLDALEKSKATFDKMVDEGRSEDAMAYADKYAEKIALGKAAGQLKAQLGKLKQTADAIRQSDMSPAEKRKALDEVRQAQIDYAREVRAALSERAR